MEHEPVERFVPAAIIKEDQADHHAGIGKRFDLAIELPGVTFVKGSLTVGDDQELREIDVERGVFNPEGAGIIHHLDLEALFGGGRGKGPGIGRSSVAGGEEEESYTESTKKGHRKREEKEFVNVQRRANARNQ